MNDINELLKIIKDIGTLEFNEICEEYQKRNHIYLSPFHKITIARTLKDYFENKTIKMQDDYQTKMNELEENISNTITKLGEQLDLYFSMGYDNSIVKFTDSLSYLINKHFTMEDIYSLEEIKHYLTNQYDLEDIIGEKRIVEYASVYSIDEIYENDVIKEWAKDHYDLMEQYDAIEYAIDILKGEQ